MPKVVAKIEKMLELALKENQNLEVCEKLKNDLTAAQQVQDMNVLTYHDQDEKYKILRELITEYLGKDFQIFTK